MTIPSTIGEERETNPFMRASDGEALAILRTAKDNF
jgi:hydroxyacylglutathione hydrolase